MRTFLKQILLVGGGMMVLLFFFLPFANLALAKTLVAIVSDRSAADLAAGADYFHRRHAEHQLVFRSNSQISRMSDTEVESLLKESDVIVLSPFLRIRRFGFRAFFLGTRTNW